MQRELKGYNGVGAVVVTRSVQHMASGLRTRGERGAIRISEGVVVCVGVPSGRVNRVFVDNVVAVFVQSIAGFSVCGMDRRIAIVAIFTSSNGANRRFARFERTRGVAVGVAVAIEVPGIEASRIARINGTIGVRCRIRAGVRCAVGVGRLGGIFLAFGGDRAAQKGQKQQQAGRVHARTLREQLGSVQTFGGGGRAFFGAGACPLSRIAGQGSASFRARFARPRRACRAPGLGARSALSAFLRPAPAVRLTRAGALRPEHGLPRLRRFPRANGEQFWTAAKKWSVAKSARGSLGGA